MARPLRIEFPGALYHVTSRGNARQDIALDDEDRAAFLAVLAEVRARFAWLVHAYCLMGNHYHLLVETPEANLSRGMRQLNGVYTQRFNRRHGRVGHVFQGRYKAILVERESYLLELCRYVVLNPLRAGMVGKPGDYRWSSYRATVGREPAPAFLTTDWVLAQFARRRVQAQEAYRAFVAAGTGRASPWSDLAGQAFLGGEDFVERLRPRPGDADLSEVPRRTRLAGRPALGDILGPGEGLGKPERNRRIVRAHLAHGYTLAEIARHSGLHYTTVSKIVKASTL